MSDTPTYLDIRSEFWRALFEQASDYEAYLAEGNQEKVPRWRDSEKRVPALSEGQLRRIQGYDREMNVLVYSGIWCGDCSRQGPLLKKLAEACGEKVKIRFIERDASPELMGELRIVGATRVPIVVFLSEDFWEMARFGERTLSVYRAGILSPKARKRELADWVDIFERILIMLRLSPPLRRRHGD